MRISSIVPTAMLSRARPAACGFAMADVVAVAVVILLAGSLLIPWLARGREVARREACMNNLRHIGVAIENYHDAYRQYPRHGTGTHDPHSAGADTGSGGPDGNGGGNNGMVLSYLVPILPFIEQQGLWEEISNPSGKSVTGGTLADGASWNAMGPAPWQREYAPWMAEISRFRCPSDLGKGDPAMGRTNFAACLGDALDFQTDSAFRFDEAADKWQIDPMAAKRVAAAGRGAFVFRVSLKRADITDGLSTTLLVGEIVTCAGDLDARTNPAVGYGDMWSGLPPRGGIFDNSVVAIDEQHLNPDRPRDWCMDREVCGARPTLTKGADEKRGLRWADARTVFTGFNTCLYPNSYLQLERMGVGGAAVAPLSSRHGGGGHVLFADGATRFITDSIEAGDSRGGSVRFGMTDRVAPGSESPFGFWGALGTRAGVEAVEW